MCQYSCNSSGTLHTSWALCWCVHWQCASCNASFGQSSFHRCDSWMDGRWRDPLDNYCQPFSLRTNKDFILLLEWTSSKQDTACPTWAVLLTQWIVYWCRNHYQSLIDVVTSSEMGLQWSCILEGLVANMTQHFLVFTVYSPNVSPTGDFLWKRATTQTAAEVLSNNLDLVFHI